MSITLHPKLGVNPRLTFCPRCKADGAELVLPGIKNHKRVCVCGAELYFAPKNCICPVCHSSLDQAEKIELKEFERVPGDYCDNCVKECAEFKKMVDEGGVYWQCVGCGTQGVLKADHPLAVETREKTKVAAPKPLGVKFTECPHCEELRKKPKPSE